MPGVVERLLDEILYPATHQTVRGTSKAGIPLPMLLPATTAAKFFSRLGIQTYGFTPMVLPEEFNFMQTIHAADERIPVEALDFGTEDIYKVLQRFGNK